MSSHPVGMKQVTRLAAHLGAHGTGALDSSRADEARRDKGVQASIVF